MLPHLRTISMLLGGKVNIAILALLFLTLFLISIVIRRKSFKIIFACLASLFILLQTTSLFFTQEFIGYQFYIHFNPREIAGLLGLYKFHLVLALLIFVILSFTFIKSELLLKYKKTEFLNVKVITSIVTICLCIIGFEGSFISNSKSLLTIFASPQNDANLKEVLQQSGMSDYTHPKDIQSVKGKNVIIICLESVEKSFLGGKFTSLTPNLQDLKEEWSYYDLSQNSGSGWTSASIYTSLTGFPAYFGVDGNNIFQSVYQSEITSISHIFNKANYQTIFIKGNTNYSGTKQMLRALDFDKIVDKNSVLSILNLSKYGLRDTETFELAKNEVTLQKSKDQNFALFITTTDTHFPNGIYDSRFENILPKQDSQLNFMVSALDYLVADFVSFLKKNNHLEDTIIYIYPDHLKMGDPSIFEDERGLFLITNASESTLEPITREKLYQIDLPKIILKGANVKHNVKFLTDYIQQEDKNDYIQNNYNLLASINTNGLLSTKVPIIKKLTKSDKKTK